MVEVWAILEAPASAAANATEGGRGFGSRTPRFTVESLYGTPLEFDPGFSSLMTPTAVSCVL